MCAPVANDTGHVDTPFSMARWNVSLWLVRVALKIAPSGSAKDQLAFYLREWGHECVEAWRLRYGSVDYSAARKDPLQ